MRLPSLFKTQKPKAFNYKPRYYDERKERLEALKNRKESRSDEEYFQGYRPKGFKDNWKATRKSSADKNSRLRFIVILILLLLFAWYALKEIKLETLF
ncbi:hypothetical protein [Galbibacter sp.]|uniref:hypothetical protein n=1 Tax=Galbibacter sp. TaxID=2918471 RepID=UPI002C9B49A7|nr:hypothetical protein [Galbibacter sp.]HLV62013.1 hypothetical protein [Galbibacter sp.]